MKNIFTLVFFSLFTFQLHAQYSKYIIQFTDKGSSTFSLSAPFAFLSARAIERRTNYKLSYDSTDLPVSQKYIDSITSKGAVILLSRSKWLNQVLIQTTDVNALQKIKALPFVKSALPFGLKINSALVTEKFKETASPIDISTQSKQEGDVLNYGNSFNQVHIHNGEYLHNNGYKGEGKVIAVLDGGFFQYKTVKAFDSARANNQFLGERDFVTFDNSVNEDDAHGMQCLSFILANWPGNMVGTAPKAKFWLLRTENSGSEYPVEEHNWVVGAEFADSVGADMISSSLGYNTFDDPAFNHTYNDLYKNNTMVSKGATLAAKKGMIVMNSAGNEGNSSWKYILFPADADSVCAVGAVNNSGAIASFSSYGYPGKVKPNIVSVGQGAVYVTPFNTLAAGNGTSYANPNIAGLIACLWQAFPQFNNMEILDAVYRSSDRYNNPDDRYGFGIPDFKKAFVILKHKQNEFKLGTGAWMIAYPVPFNNNLSVTVRSNENANASVTLTDAAGRMIERKTLAVVTGQQYDIEFSNLAALAKGVYFIHYKTSSVKKTVKIIKQ
jgi:serine protease AprX